MDKLSAVAYHKMGQARGATHPIAGTLRNL